MDWTQTIFIVGSLGSLVLGIMLWFTSRISKDINRIDTDIKAQGQRIDQSMSRIDQLYQMFVDLLRENNKKD